MVEKGEEWWRWFHEKVGAGEGGEMEVVGGRRKMGEGGKAGGRERRGRGRERKIRIRRNKMIKKTINKKYIKNKNIYEKELPK